MQDLRQPQQIQAWVEQLLAVLLGLGPEGEQLASAAGEAIQEAAAAVPGELASDSHMWT